SSPVGLLRFAGLNEAPTGASWFGAKLSSRIVQAVSASSGSSTIRRMGTPSSPCPCLVARARPKPVHITIPRLVTVPAQIRRGSERCQRRPEDRALPQGILKRPGDPFCPSAISAAIADEETRHEISLQRRFLSPLLVAFWRLGENKGPASCWPNPLFRIGSR